MNGVFTRFHGGGGPCYTLGLAKRPLATNYTGNNAKIYEINLCLRVKQVEPFCGSAWTRKFRGCKFEFEHSAAIIYRVEFDREFTRQSIFQFKFHS